MLHLICRFDPDSAVDPAVVAVLRTHKEEGTPAILYDGVAARLPSIRRLHHSNGDHDGVLERDELEDADEAPAQRAVVATLL